ncbi:MAG: hypothetical protein ACLFUF_07630 [Opitutales bacterium]
MAKFDRIAQLSALNGVLVATGVAEAERAAHARRALEYFRSEADIAELSSVSVQEGAERLIRIHGGTSGDNGVAVEHWHVPDKELCTPLWVRHAVIGAMKKLAGRERGVLLVTGAREAICPFGRKWTKARAAEYGRFRQWVEELAQAWGSSNSRLQVVVL